MTAPLEDGNLPAARKYLADAIHGLAGRTTTTIDGRVHWGDSLYQQLRDNLGGMSGGGGEGAHSQPPIWLDATTLLDEIDSAIRREQPDPGIFDGDLSREPIPETVRRLHLIEDRSWRPQDTHKVQQIADACVEWAHRILNLFEPPARKSLPNPCPACDTRVVYRKDSGGETVRQPALQIGANGCVCGACHTVWSPEYFVHLARVLGYPLAPGCLE